MAGYDAAFREATNSLEADRGRAEASVKSRREALYVKYPRLKEIEDRSVVLGGALVKSALDGPGSQTADIAAEIESLNLEKDELMRRAGLPRDYYSSAYACPACLDTGRTANPDGTGKRCQCFRRRLTEAYYGLSNVKAAVEEENFERFDLRYYSNQKDLNEGLSPAENMRTVLKATKEFVDNFGNKFQNLLLYGV
ncbi:MAG: hypothetical protein FWF03_04875, partial [Defluviitaleaceae bacterium]|nr:hypothetical protein [Defluviitaleaceae bacterium]